MSVSGNPPYSWVDGTNLAGKFIKSQQICEAMQALTNRADNIIFPIANWKAYDYDGSVLADLGQTPLDADLQTNKAFRHADHIADLRTALEAILGAYHDDSGTAYTKSSLLQAAVGRNDYNRTIAELQALGYFDGEDLEEILKCIDLLTLTPDLLIYINGDLVALRNQGTILSVNGVWGSTFYGHTVGAGLGTHKIIDFAASGISEANFLKFNSTGGNDSTFIDPTSAASDSLDGGATSIALSPPVTVSWTHETTTLGSIFTFVAQHIGGATEVGSFFLTTGGNFRFSVRYQANWYSVPWDGSAASYNIRLVYL